MDQTSSAHQPRYVFRGHGSAVHAVSFAPDNLSMLTGDADGWIVDWALTTRRPVAVWRAHHNAVLGLSWWGLQVFRHGRDSKLIVWRLEREDLESMDMILPVDQSSSQNRTPQILHELTVNTMNFCSFACCSDPASLGIKSETSYQKDALLVSLPHTLDSEAIDIFHLPSTNRLGVIPVSTHFKSGMVMALFMHANRDGTCVAAGYESGHVALYMNTSRKIASPSTLDSDGRGTLYIDNWICIYISKPHKQPVLSLLASKDERYLVSTAADSVVATHVFLPVINESVDHEEKIQGAQPVEEACSCLKTRHAGQQGLSTNGSGKIFASAGWDGAVRIYSWNKLQEIQSLEWHRDGVYATAFANALAGDGVKNPSLPSSQPVPYLQGTLAIRREQQARLTPWLAVGGKDGKVSLWIVKDKNELD